MLQKYRSNPGLQSIVIAVSIAIISSIFGLAAYLTNQTDPLSATFKMRYGREFGIEISSDNYSEGSDILAGETAAFDPHLTNNGNYDAYVFMEVSIPDSSFSLSSIDSDWQKLDSATSNDVYYYGSPSSLTILPAVDKSEDGTLTASETNPLCSAISLDKSTTLKQGDYTFEVTGYAIQAENVDGSSPSEVWDMIGGSK